MPKKIENIFTKKSYVRIFIAALFLIVETAQVSVNRWMDKDNMYTMEYHSAIKRNKRTCAPTQTSLGRERRLHQRPRQRSRTVRFHSPWMWKMPAPKVTHCTILFTMSRTGKSRETEVGWRLPGAGGRKEQVLTVEWVRGFFGRWWKISGITY